MSEVKCPLSEERIYGLAKHLRIIMDAGYSSTVLRQEAESALRQAAIEGYKIGCEEGAENQGRLIKAAQNMVDAVKSLPK